MVTCHWQLVDLYLALRCFEYFGEMIHQSQLTTNVAENPSDVLQAANLHVFKGGTERPHFQLRNLEQGPFHRPSKFETARNQNLPTSS
jgi:hypothetical protein